MSSDKYIVGKPGHYKLILREWDGGHRPDYHILKYLSDVEAYAMNKGGISHLYRDDIIKKPRIRVKCKSEKV